ncbi:hypothetical protein KIN20_023699 [Parelaphostrongylus tenuis]|uniref:MARVEL domain-containing protein n=1 Tax=Parelaphostrongylus tenuis TaxID=148309 RepID=A0AAD5MSF4_PARTN|nr:hypothetical protein KIN20_023699 [Parelaphostrongylus tenuis]
MFALYSVSTKLHEYVNKAIKVGARLLTEPLTFPIDKRYLDWETLHTLNCIKMNCTRIFRTFPNLHVLFTLNSILICFLYLWYSFDWVRHTTICNHSVTVISYVAGISVIFYVCTSIISGVLFCFYLNNIDRHPRCSRVILIAFSCISFLYAVASFAAMFISLYIEFNPACRDSTKDVLYMAAVCGYNLASHFVVLLFSILCLESTSSDSDVKTASAHEALGA